MSIIEHLLFFIYNTSDMNAPEQPLHEMAPKNTERSRFDTILHHLQHIQKSSCISSVLKHTIGDLLQEYGEAEETIFQCDPRLLMKMQPQLQQKFAEEEARENAHRMELQQKIADFYFNQGLHLLEVPTLPQGKAAIREIQDKTGCSVFSVLHQI